MSACPKVMQTHSLNSLPPYTQLGVPTAGTYAADGGSPAEPLSTRRRRGRPPRTAPTGPQQAPGPPESVDTHVGRAPDELHQIRVPPARATPPPRQPSAVEEVEEVGRSEGVEGAHVEAQHAAAASREPRRPVVGASAGGGPFGPRHGSQAGGLGARATHVTCVKWR